MAQLCLWDMVGSFPMWEMGWEGTVSSGYLGVTEPNSSGLEAVLGGRGERGGFPALRWDPSLSSGTLGWSQQIP